MEQAMANLANQLVQNLAPMVISMMVVVLAFTVLMVKVRSQAIRSIGATAAMFVWVGWMANFYKVV